MRKRVYKFIIVFILTFILVEIVEHLLEYFFDINFGLLTWGWFGFIVVYGFKFHILCCLIPAIWASYKCRHKKCDHDYCDHDKNNK